MIKPAQTRTPNTDDLIQRLRDVPVWMVESMRPMWQAHGATAYEAASEIERLTTLHTFIFEQIHGLDGWRQLDIQAIGAAISNKNWHAVEAAYNSLRDRMDCAKFKAGA